MTDERVDARPYEAPRIDERAPIDLPLIGTGSAQFSAAFRPL